MAVLVVFALVGGVFDDVGDSGATLDRPGMLALLERVDQPGDRPRRVLLAEAHEPRPDPVSGQVEQLTHHDPWDVRWPATDQVSRIVYELDGQLRVFNDDTLSPGSVWPLHPHRNIEVVTYCAAGEFLHACQVGPCLLGQFLVMR